MKVSNEHVKTSEVLTAAKKYLWDGKDATEFEDLIKPKTEFICSTITYAMRFELGGSSAPLVKLKHKTMDIITNRLLPWNNMESWLEYAAHVPKEHLIPVLVQAHRLAWMNQLINEFKAKGD